MPRKSVLTPRMEAEIEVAELENQYKAADMKLERWRAERRSAAEMVAAAERNFANISTLCDDAYKLKWDLFRKLEKAQDAYNRLQAEFDTSVSEVGKKEGEES